MSLTKAIRFRYLSDQLNQTELNQFVTKLLESQPNIILTSLFQHFIKSPSNNHDEVNNINKSLSNIIQLN